MDTQFNPIYRELKWDGDFDVPEGFSVILRSLFLNDANAILFVEADAEIFFI